MRKNIQIIGFTVFALVGLFVLVSVVGQSSNYQSNAAAINSIEPENGTLAGAVTVGNDTNASGGKYVRFESLSTTITPTPNSNPIPYGSVPGSWTLKFDDEFNGTVVDNSKWIDNSSAEADAGHGNQGNQQLEWNQLANCTVANGALTMTAKRQFYTSASGKTYNWTSCLLTTTPSFSFQYGYIEERSILPSEKGFWPAFWTWQAPSVNSWQETDGYEFYSDNHTKLYLTSHVGSGGGCTYTIPFDPTSGYHVYGANIQASGTDWYIDGTKVCHAAGYPSATTNIITNLAVYSQIQPLSNTNTATKQVDYIRAW